LQLLQFTRSFLCPTSLSSNSSLTSPVNSRPFQGHLSPSLPHSISLATPSIRKQPSSTTAADTNIPRCHQPPRNASWQTTLPRNTTACGPARSLACTRPGPIVRRIQLGSAALNVLFLPLPILTLTTANHVLQQTNLSFRIKTPQTSSPGSLLSAPNRPAINSMA
jgi:hypothetical protein